jgi:hypothetical protein
MSSDNDQLLMPNDLQKATLFITSHRLIIIFKYNDRSHAEVLKGKSPIIKKERYNTYVYGQQNLQNFLACVQVYIHIQGNIMAKDL